MGETLNKWSKNMIASIFDSILTAGAMLAMLWAWIVGAVIFFLMLTPLIAIDVAAGTYFTASLGGIVAVLIAWGIYNA